MILMLLGQSLVIGQTREPELRPVFVPPERQDLWPAGDWVKIPGELLSGRNPTATPAPYLKQAEYTGSLKDEVGSGDPLSLETMVLEGSFTWLSQRPVGAAQPVNLGSPSIALFDVETSEPQQLSPVSKSRTAAWGVNASGKTEILVSEGEGKTVGLWAAQLTVINGVGRARLRLPLALTTSLELTLPNSLIVESTNSLINRKTANSNPNDAQLATSVWTIRPDRSGVVDLAIRATSRVPSESAMTVARTVSTTVTANLLTWSADFRINVTGTRPRAIPIVIPDDVAIDELIIGTTRLSDPTPVSVAGRTVVRVPIPSNDDVRIQITGRRSFRGYRVTIPELVVPEALVTHGEVSVSVMAPLRLERVEASGYEQVVSDLDSGSGDLVEFQQQNERARLRLYLNRPETAVSATATTAFDVSQPVPEVVSAIDIATTASPVFSIDLSWQSGWSVTSVETADGLPVADWRMTNDSPARPLIAVTLSRPVNTNSPTTLVIRGRSTLGHQLASWSFDPILVNGSEARSQFVCIVGSEKLAVQTDDAWRAQSLTRISDLSDLPQTATSTIDSFASSVTAVYRVATSERIRFSSPTQSGNLALNASIAETSNTQDPRREVDEADEFDPVAVLADLDISWSSVSNPVVRCVATFRFNKPIPPSDLGLTLPEEVRVNSIACSGELVPSVVVNGKWVPVTDESTDSLSVVYSVDASEGTLLSETKIPVPELFSNGSHTPAVALSSKIHLPVGLEFVEAATGPLVASRGYKVSRWQRLFGPLGRNTQSHWFRPWSARDWLDVFRGRPNDSTLAASQTELFHPIAPTSIVIVLVRPGQALAIGWQLWWLALAVVTFVRSIRPRYWRRALAAIVTGLGLTTVLVVDAYALPVGGLFCGSLFAMLLPRFVIRKGLPTANDELDRSSTALLSSVVRVTVVTGITVGSATHLLAAGEESIDVIVPRAEGEALTNWASGPVYVRPETAALLKSQTAASGYLIRGVNLSITPENSGIDVVAQYDVVRKQSGAGVVIPLGEGIVVDPDSVSVNSDSVTPLPVEAGIFVPVNNDDAETANIRLNYTVTRSQPRFLQNRTSFKLPASRLPNVAITLSTKVDPFVKGSCLQIDEATYRGLPDREPLMMSPNTSDIPSENPTGTYHFDDLPLATRGQYSVTIPHSFIHEEIEFVFPKGAVVSGPASPKFLSVTTPNSKPTGDSWTAVRIGEGQQRVLLRFDNVLYADRVEISFQTWKRGKNPASIGPGDVSNFPQLLVGGTAVPIDWRRVTKTSDSSQLEPGRTTSAIDTESSIGDRVGTVDSNRVVAAELSGELADTRIEWSTHIIADIGSKPIYSMTFDFVGAFIFEAAEVTVNGRPHRHRASTTGRRVDLLFDGVVEGKLEVTLRGTSQRGVASVRIPRLEIPGFDLAETAGTCTLMNRSTFPATIVLDGSDSETLWDQKRVFDDWPRSGPTSIRRQRSFSRPEVQSAYVVNSRGEEKIILAMSAAPTLTQRTVPLPPGFEFAESDDIETGVNPANVLKTTTASSHAVLVLNRTDASARLDEVRLPSVERVIAGPTWVALDTSAKRIVLNAETVSVDELPTWLRERLTPEFRGSTYRVKQNLIRFTERAAELGPTTIEKTSHAIWTESVARMSGVTRWSFSRPGTFKITENVDRRDAALFIDGDSVQLDSGLPPGSGREFAVSESALLFWSRRPESRDAVLPLPELAAPASGETTVFVTGQGRLPEIIGAKRNAVEVLDSDSMADTIAFDDMQPARLAQIVTGSAVDVYSADDDTMQDVSIRANNQGWWAYVSTILLGVFGATILVWKTDHENFWSGVADYLAPRPRLVTAGFGITWWLFLIPSFLGIIVLSAVVLLVLFRPQDDAEVTIGVSSGE